MDSQQNVSRGNELICNPPLIDCLSGGSDLKKVVGRVALASVAFTVASSAFQMALCISFLRWWWDPPVILAMNVITVAYMVSILVPAALVLSWIYRYNQPSPCQERRVSTGFNASHTFDLCLGALASINADITEIDEETGRIKAIRPARRHARSQEITIALSNSCEESTSVIINSRAILNPVEALLFGYSLAVDGGASERNVKQVTSFLKWHAELTPGIAVPVTGSKAKQISGPLPLRLARAVAGDLEPLNA